MRLRWGKHRTPLGSILTISGLQPPTHDPTHHKTAQTQVHGCVWAILRLALCPCIYAPGFPRYKPPLFVVSTAPSGPNAPLDPKSGRFEPLSWAKGLNVQFRGHFSQVQTPTFRGFHPLSCLVCLVFHTHLCACVPAL